MAQPTATVPTQHISLNAHLFTESKAPDDLRHLLLDIARAAKYIQFAIRTTDTGLMGTRNSFGEEQVRLDVLSDDIIHRHLVESRLVACIASEERDDVLELSSTAPYSVVYDPLDGSSLVETNLAIGSIFGIYQGRTLIGATPRKQVAAVYTLYGPRTILVYSTGNGVHEFLLNDVGEFVVLRQYLGIADTAKNYSPGNLRAISENRGYGVLLQDWLDAAWTLRYSGCMVADIHHIFSKGQGIFTHVGGSSYPEGKLRLLFECGPFAYLAEQAGGAASNGKCPILDTCIRSLDQQTPIVIGSSASVAAACTRLSQD